MEKEIEDFSDMELLQELRTRNYAITAWCDEDVLHRAKELGIKCDADEAAYICNEMDRKHDASLGITWDTIDYYLSEL